MDRVSDKIDSLLASLNPLAAAWSRARCEYALQLPSTELYVKTIYLGAHVDGQMFAALYPGAGGFELALAVPEDLPGSDLIDASHLTWPTMPLALSVATSFEVEAVAGSCCGTDWTGRVEQKDHPIIDVAPPVSLPQCP